MAPEAAMQTTPAAKKKLSALSPAASAWVPRTTIASAAASSVPAFVPSPTTNETVAASTTTPKCTSALKASAKSFTPKPTAKEFIPKFALPVEQSSPSPVTPPTTDVVKTEDLKKTETIVEAKSDTVATVVDPVEFIPSTFKEPETESSPVPAKKTLVTAEPVAPVSAADMVKKEAPTTASVTTYLLKQLLALQPLKRGDVMESLVNYQCFRPLHDIPGSTSHLNSPSTSNNKNNSRDNNRRGNRNNNDRRGHRGGNNHYHHQDTAPALEDCKPLEINEETRWKPMAKVEANSNEFYIKQANSILNKLSIEKFERLSDEFIEVAVANREILSECIRFVVEKAQMEWHFSKMYAELCSKLARSDMPSIKDENEEQVEDTSKLFRKLLLVRCQNAFEEEANREGFEDLSGPELAESELILKRKTLGHIRFVGELYQQSMLSSRVMHFCIQRLFGDIENVDEENLECLCKLLSTIGYKIENFARSEDEQANLTQYYKIITELSERQSLCTRIRFMLKDLLELRMNNWVARRDEEEAMTIAQIHEKAAQEDRKKSKQPAPALKRQNSDGWETVPQRSRSFKGSKSHQSFTGRNSSINSKFSKPSGFSGNRSNKESTRPTTILPRSTSNATKPSVTKAKPALTKEEFSKKVKSELKDCFSTGDEAEAVLRLNEVCAGASDECLSSLLSVSLATGFEKSQKEQELIGSVLGKVFESKEGLLKITHLETGVADTLNFLDDLAVDYPMITTYVERMICPLIECEALSLQYVAAQLVAEELNVKKGSTLMLELLKSVAEGDDEEDLVDSYLKEHRASFIALFAPDCQNEDHAASVLASHGL